MNNRIKEIRKENKDTQQNLADKIGLKQGTIAQFEKGTAIPSQRTIKDICQVYNINKKWLEKGEAPKSKGNSERELKIKQLEKALEGKGDYLLDGIKIIVDMKPDEQKIVLDMGFKIHELHKSKEFVKRINKKV